MKIFMKNVTCISIVGTAKVPVGVINAPGTLASSTGVMKLCGIPLLFLISGTTLNNEIKFNAKQILFLTEHRTENVSKN